MASQLKTKFTLCVKFTPEELFDEQVRTLNMRCRPWENIVVEFGEEATFEDLLNEVRKTGYLQNIDGLKAEFGCSESTLLTDPVFDNYNGGNDKRYGISIVKYPFTSIVDAEAARSAIKIDEKIDDLDKELVEETRRHKERVADIKEHMSGLGKLKDDFLEQAYGTRERTYPTYVGRPQWTKYQLSKLEESQQ